MRKICILACTLSVLALAACGGGGTGDDVAVMPDAHTGTHPDANTGAPDSNTTSNNVATKLGKVCSGPSDCPAEAPNCIRVESAATTGFCSLGCGQTANPTDNPPAGGDAMCQAQYDGTSGTPVCLANDQATPANWSCLVACGTFQTTDLGMCPNNEMCYTADNVCN